MAMTSTVLPRLARLLYPFGSRRRVLRGPLRRLRFTVAPGMGVSYALGRDNHHFAFLAARIRPGMTVYDLGANRGQLALFFAQAVGPAGIVVSFEPVRHLYEDLVGNVALNGLKNVVAYCLAVSDRCGETAFAFNSQYPTQGKLVACEPTYVDPLAVATPVRAMTLDALAEADRLPPPGLMKIDVEGAAELVLRGATQTIERHSPNVFIELHGPEEQQAVKEHLLGRGYQAFNLAGAPVEDPIRRWQSPLWCTRAS
jgi:FkbM family methyltransferase